MRKVVEMIMVEGDAKCDEIRGFLEENEVHLNIRDIKKQPLNYREIEKIIRFLDLKHFVNTASKSYAKNKLDSELPSRTDLFKLMSEDNDLLNFPIIVAGRLMVVGPNRHKIMEMLQIKANGNGNGAGDNNFNSTSSIRRESPGGRSYKPEASRHEAAKRA